MVHRSKQYLNLSTQTAHKLMTMRMIENCALQQTAWKNELQAWTGHGQSEIGTILVARSSNRCSRLLSVVFMRAKLYTNRRGPSRISLFLVTIFETLRTVTSQEKASKTAALGVQQSTRTWVTQQRVTSCNKQTQELSKPVVITESTTSKTPRIGYQTQWLPSSYPATSYSANSKTERFGFSNQS